jgi:small-conductance mechanosensitive channel
MTLVVLSILALACSCVVVAGFNFKLPSTRTSVRRRHDILAIAERMEGFKGGAQTSGASDFKSPDEPSKVKPKGLFNTRFMEYFFRSLLGMVIVDYDVLRIVSKFCAAIFWLFAGLSIAGSVGFDTKPFLGLFSISLVGLGYGAKDILSSTFAGICT